MPISKSREPESVRGYLRKSSPFTSFSLTFGRLTTKFEMLFQTKKQGCRRQPCSLSPFDSLKPIQSGFFGSRGLFPKKVPEWGLGRSPIYNGSGSGCGATPRIYFPLYRGMGRSPIKIVPHVGVRGAEMRKIVLPAGREASRKPLPAP